MWEALVAGLAGLLIGSFLNVCIYRMPRDLSVVHPRSFCPGCNRMIAWYDNVPVLSYLLLGGKCRHCRIRIPLRYPLVEALTALCFALLGYQYGFTLETLKLCVFSALLVGLIFSDFEKRILPDEFTKGGMALGVAFAAFVPLPVYLFGLFFPDAGRRWISVGESVLAAAFMSGSLWSLGRVYAAVRKREGLGLGDVKMVGMIGAFLGLQGALLTMIVGSVAGSVLGLLFIAIAKKEASSYELPFGTFLGVGALLVTLLAGRLSPWLGY